MAASDKELAQRLTEAGSNLLNPPSSVEELLSLLDKVHDCLSKVEQSPPKSLQNALSPSQKALVADNLLRHPDEDVKVAVAASISEITRITAPDAPYDDEQMKEVFQLIVSSFENIVDKSSRSFAKRTSILETVAKVRSCVVMLDLECDALIIEMFRHFLKAVRDHHPENVFSSMETIMTLVLEESEDIPLELLSAILDYVKKDNEEVLPISRKLAERVLQSCATKLKPYLIEAVKSLGLSLDNYSNIVASIWQGTSVGLEQNDVASNEKNTEGNLATDSTPEKKEKPTEEVSPQQVDAPNDSSVKSVVGNGDAQTREDDSLTDSGSTKKQEDSGLADEPKKIDKLDDTGTDKTSIQKEVGAGHEEKQTMKKKGKKPNAVKLIESSTSSIVEKGMESKTRPDSKDDGKDLACSPLDDPSSANAMAGSENEKEIKDQVSPPKQAEGESTSVASPSQRESHADESRSNKTVQQKKKKSSTKGAKPFVDEASNIASEGPSDSEVKPAKKSGKKVASGSSSRKKPTAGATKKGINSSSNSKAKLLKQLEKKVDADDDDMEESSKQEDKKKRGPEEASSMKGAMEKSLKDDKETVSSPKDDQQEETPKVNSKRKRSLGKEKASDVKEYGENLIGSRIKVWWPYDRTFYDGVVDSFDASKKKHLVLYDDGEQEILNLKRQKWEFIEDDSESAQEETANKMSPEAKSGMRQKKKATTGGDQLAKETKSNASAKRGGGGASSKSKAAATKSGKKSKDSGKAETKLKDTCKATGKMETDSDVETDDDEKLKTGGKPDAVSKPTGKSKNDESTTPKSDTTKASAKTKEETPKTSRSKQEYSNPSARSKGNSRKSSGSGKSRSAVSSKAKEAGEEELADDTPKAPEASKGKSSGSTKALGNQAKSGKKRKR